MVCSGLTRDDHENIHSFCRRLFAMEDVDEVRRASLLFFESQLGAEKGNFFLAETPDKPVSFHHIVNRGIDDAALRHYRRYYWRIDPFYRRYAGRNPFEIPDVLTTEDVVSYKNLTRTEYYNDFLKPQSIHHQMTIHLKSGWQVVGVVALFRSRRARRFSPHDRLKALSAAPCLSGAIQSAVSSEKNQALASAIRSMIPDLPCRSLVILDRFLEDAVHQRIHSGKPPEIHLSKNGRFQPDGRASPVVADLAPEFTGLLTAPGIRARRTGRGAWRNDPQRTLICGGRCRQELVGSL